jgi:site-specific DNA recombinase
MPHKIGIYIRVSTEEQALRNEGSLDSQEHRLNGYIDIKNMQEANWGVVVEKYVDDVSAKDTNRPSLQKMIRDLKNGRINMVLVTDISRLSRSIRDFCMLIDLFKETKTKFLSLKDQFDTTTAAGEMMLFNMINLAQFERRQISERVSLNFHSRAMRGLRNGGSTILGFRVDPANKSVLTVNEDEVSLVKYVFDSYNNEGSLYKTAAKLREQNIPFRGNENTGWNVRTLMNLLRNHSYIGIREVNKGNKYADQSELNPIERYQVVKAAWPAIIDETTFNEVQKMLDDNAKNERHRLKNAKARVFMISGISTCGECGRALVGSTGHGKKKEIRYYIHRPVEGKPVTCSVKRIRAEEVEEVIENHLLHVIQREGYLDGVEGAIVLSLSGERDALTALQKENKKKLDEADSDIKKVVRLQMLAEMTDLNCIYKEQLLELQAERLKFRETLNQVEDQLSRIIDPKEFRNSIEVNLRRLQMAWEKAAPKMKKALLKIVLNRLVFNKDNVEIYYRPTKENFDLNQSTEKEMSAGQKPVDIFEKRIARNLDVRHPPLKSERGQDIFSRVWSDYFLKPTHNEKVSGWYIVKDGCGSRI